MGNTSLAHPDRHSIVNVTVLPTGSLALPRRWIFAGREDGNNIRAPDFSFLIEHIASGEKILFDLGYRKDLDSYPPAIANLRAVDIPECREDAADLLGKGGVAPSDIKRIVLSHIHHDHSGDIRKFPDSELVLGPGSTSLLPGYPQNAKAGFLTSSIEPPSGKTTELPPVEGSTGVWELLENIWPSAHDFFGDGSFYLLDAPGHIQGHIMGLARTGQEEFVLMGGDACHDPLLFVYADKYDISEKVSLSIVSLHTSNNAELKGQYGPGPVGGMHKDPAAARRTIAGIRKLHQREDILIVMAHDYSLQDIIPQVPEVLNGWRDQDLKRKAARVWERVEKDDLERYQQWTARKCCCAEH